MRRRWRPGRARLLPHLLAVVATAAFFVVVATARQPPAAPATLVVNPIVPPAIPLPSEAASADVTRFSFIAYGDTRGQADGVELQTNHGLVVDAMLAKVKALASTPFPVRFVLQSGDSVVNGRMAVQWNVSFAPLIEKLTRGAGLPYFSAVGNHDVTTMPVGSPGRATGLQNAMSAMAKLIPAEGSPRRLKGYPTYAIGYGNLFLLAIDSNIAADPEQAAWVKDQLEHLDRRRYRHVIAAFHHPPFSSGPHGADTVEPQTATIRMLYLPLFRAHHVRMTLTGHDHLLDHWVEHYVDSGRTYRRDDVVSGGGGAPTYTYKGEPDLRDYLAASAAQKVRIDHLAKPGPAVEDNPHHFVVVQVDGDRLSIEVVGSDTSEFKPYNGSARISLDESPS
jgi:hypothetical protein